MALEGESGVLTPEKSLCSHQLDQDFVREKLFMLEVRRDLNVDSCYVLTDTLETVEKDAKNTMKHLDEKLQKMREKTAICRSFYHEAQRFAKRNRSKSKVR